MSVDPENDWRSRARRGAIGGLAVGIPLSLLALVQVLLQGSNEIKLRSGEVVQAHLAIEFYVVGSMLVGMVIALTRGLFRTKVRAYLTGTVLGIPLGVALMLFFSTEPLRSPTGAITVAVFSLLICGYGGLVVHDVHSSWARDAESGRRSRESGPSREA